MIIAKLEGGMMETTNSISNRYAKLLEGSWLTQFRYGSNPWMARYVYSVLFLLANLFAWAVRDYGPSALTEMKRLKSCEGGKDCLGTEGVLRVSMGCFVSFISFCRLISSYFMIQCLDICSYFIYKFREILNIHTIFYFTMFVSTVGTSKLHGRKELWHSGWWSAKIFMMIALIVLPFFLPTEMILIYGDIAHFGAGVFLLIQLISIISFINWLNDCCLSEKYAARCHIHSMLLATAAYIVSILGIILMYIWYTPQSSCLLNIFFITWTLVLLQLMTSVSLHPKINAGFLTPGLMGLYIVFLCWSAIRSEPDDKCLRKSEASRDWLSIISFVVAVLAIVIATFSTGIDSKCFQFRKDERQDDDDDVPYGFGFFHLVFATGAMYFAMLLIGWNYHHPMKKWTIDVGWTSTWVRIVNEWLAVCVYLWMLIAPLVWKTRHLDMPT